ncbi:ABC transporter ATP-binding protein [Naumannella halotolerans]|uniref:Energy-coupling factor transport system ATP-binding protein n=1 Tax=Naumannella halotolerans TaxID=993414 RepID=A0A4R7JAS3_9ACTN|nr:ABC transporter ATP-binding protein [Naumannella halotolerans]TDT34495.1 energy-coupling factor transport system ATP-binding protein [Naumannella halotolerans]
MIDITDLGFRHADATTDLFRDVSMQVDEGELALLIGPTGAGKSTLLQVINNLVPHSTGGRRVGRVVIDGEDVTALPPRALADRIGFVGQDPLAGFVTDTVEDELAWTMEQLGVPPSAMRMRVEETLDLLGIADLRRRALRTLSGGEQQRVAIGAVLTARPRVLLLDEPTSALDPVAAEEVAALLQRLVHDLGTTVLLAEHRTERMIEHADSVIELGPDGRLRHGAPATIMADAADVPPLIDLGRRLAWEPLPLTVRDARRRAAELRHELPTPVDAPTADARVAKTPVAETPVAKTPVAETPVADTAVADVPVTDPPAAEVDGGLEANGLIVRYGRRTAVAGVDLRIAPGEVVALMGRNGSGKSSVLWALHGALSPAAGAVRVAGRPRRPGDLALVPQTPADLFHCADVAQECVAADQRSRLPPGRTRRLLQELVGPVDDRLHPRDLSEGQQLGLALALQLGGETPVIALDEPTRGLDRRAKDELTVMIGRLAAQGRAVLVATHDVEFAARTCQRVLVLAEGELVADGPVREVLSSSPLLATQVARVMAPLPYLLVDEVLTALTERGRS